MSECVDTSVVVAHSAPDQDVAIDAARDDVPVVCLDAGDGTLMGVGVGQSHTGSDAWGT